MQENESKKEDKPSRTTRRQKKLILCEAVEAYPEQNWVIMGALSQSDLLEQYHQELEDYGYKDIKPSITADELDKIIKEFLGE